MGDLGANEAITGLHIICGQIRIGVFLYRASTQQGIPRPARLTKEVPVILGNDINPQGIWVPAERVNGPVTVNTPTDRRVSTRSKAVTKFYQAGTDGKS